MRQVTVVTTVAASWVLGYGERVDDSEQWSGREEGDETLGKVQGGYEMKMKAPNLPFTELRYVVA